jgi:hypothetical protein
VGKGDDAMQYTLMHKNYPVADITLDETGIILKIGTLYDERRLPLGVGIFNSGIDRKALNDWWIGRSIPASRFGLEFALRVIGISSPIMLLGKCCGLSLSDQYWISPKDSGLKWQDINFFQNEFSKDIGEILFGHEPADSSRISLMSPDNTSDGWLRKKWIIADGKRYLMKSGSGVYHQEPFNEGVASVIMSSLGVNHVNYTLTFENENPYSLCESFITPDTDLIPAWRVLNTKKQPNHLSVRDHFIDCCDTLGIPGVVEALDKMLTVDYIIANEDRHFNNFGCVRNADTLEWLGFAPVYDSGTSLWYNTQRVGCRVESKPFRKTHDEQIKLVSDLSWFKLDAPEEIAERINGIFSASPEIDEARRTAIVNAVTTRVVRIEQMR